MKTKLAAIVATAGLLLCAQPELADARTVTGPVDQLSVEAIDSTASNTLTLQLLAPNPYSDPKPGQAPLGGLAGYTMKASRVQGIDLNTAAGWEQARSLTIDEARALGLDEPFTAITDDQGRASMSGLPVGVYLVEGVPPSDPTHRYITVKPFLITLPTGDASGTQWDYDVVIEVKTEDDPPEDPSTPPTVPIDPPVTTTPPWPGTTTEVTPPPGQGEHPTPTPPGHSESPGEKSTERGPLALTGASVIAFVIVGCLLLALGFAMTRRPREN